MNRFVLIDVIMLQFRSNMPNRFTQSHIEVNSLLKIVVCPVRISLSTLRSASALSGSPLGLSERGISHYSTS